MSRAGHERRARQLRDKLIKGGQKGPGGEHVLGSSHVEAVMQLRSMPVPPSPEGATDVEYDRDKIDPRAYRLEMNARKRARRARAGK